MDKKTRTQLDNLHSEDGDARYAAYMALMAATDQPVDWAYEAWDELLEMTRDANNHRRAIATQLLSNLAQSDPKKRMLKDFDKLLAVTHDKMFVTARHTLQALWKVGTAGKPQQKLVVERLAGRFQDCTAEKNCTLIRYDIIVDLGQLYAAVHDESIKERALELIETEPDLKYRKKYSTVFRAKKLKH
jgi:HEAT repeat protein